MSRYLSAILGLRYRLIGVRSVTHETLELGDNSVSHIAHYGSVKILRGFCPSCKGTSFIQDNTFVCCGNDAPQESVDGRSIVVAGSRQRRAKPSASQQFKLLQEQENCCFYCLREFGEVVLWHGRPVTLRLHWDHLVPYSYGYNNLDNNFVAACHICNGIKGSRMFDTTEEAREYINEKREKKEQYRAA